MDGVTARWPCCGLPKDGKMPNYCQSLDAVRAVEEKVIEKVGKFMYGHHLWTVLGLSGFYPRGEAHGMLERGAMATALQRANRRAKGSGPKHKGRN